jgi:hypothetical protein
MRRARRPGSAAREGHFFGQPELELRGQHQLEIEVEAGGNPRQVCEEPDMKRD